MLCMEIDLGKCHYCGILNFTVIMSALLERKIVDCVLLFGCRYVQQFYGITFKLATGLFVFSCYMCRSPICHFLFWLLNNHFTFSLCFVQFYTTVIFC